jgi:glycosyltransferase involved in cell wall biosynthesis
MNMSCVVPARNEEGHLDQVISQILSIECITDIIIVEGGSHDNTYLEAKKIALINPNRIKVIKQTGKCKFNAVLLGAKHASEDFLLIWDADGTVPINSTIKVIENTLSTGNVTMGNRLSGSIEPGAMQFLNLIGNWFFAVIWSPVLRGKSLDLLCGTKIIPSKIFSVIPKWLINIDPYGDFALIATARAQGLTIESVPVDYLKRQYGSTNIRRWSGGFRLLVTTFFIYIWLFCHSVIKK